MTPLDDDELTAGLRSALAEHHDGTPMPDGMAAAAWRAARRRTVTRRAAAGVPVVAAAGVAAALTIGSGGGARRASGPATAAHSSTPVAAQDTAYVIRHVKQRLADAGQDGTVIRYFQYASAVVKPDGSIGDFGATQQDGVEYFAPNGNDYVRYTDYAQHGAVYDHLYFDYLADGDGSYSLTRTVVDLPHHIYSQSQFTHQGDPNKGTAANLSSSPAEIQQALRTGTVTSTGPAEVDGTRAIALKVAVGRDGHFTLDVDAATYQPLLLWQPLPFGAYMAEDWVSATPAAISLAKDVTIPAGDRRIKVNAAAEAVNRNDPTPS